MSSNNTSALFMIFLSTASGSAVIKTKFSPIGTLMISCFVLLDAIQSIGSNSSNSYLILKSNCICMYFIFILSSCNVGFNPFFKSPAINLPSWLITPTCLILSSNNLTHTSSNFLMSLSVRSDIIS